MAAGDDGQPRRLTAAEEMAGFPPTDEGRRPESITVTVHQLTAEGVRSAAMELMHCHRNWLPMLTGVLRVRRL